MKIGGEYRNTKGPDRSLWEGRVIFLQAVERLAPRVLEELRESILPLYKEAMVETSDPELRLPRSPFGSPRVCPTAPDWWAWSWERGDWDDVTDEPEAVGRLKKGLEAWAHRWNLRNRWIFDVALRTVCAWSFDRETDGFRDPAFIDVERAPQFTFTARGWVPTWETWSEYRDRQREEFEEALQAYHEERVHWAEDAGFERAPEKRAGKARYRDEDSSRVQFDWLVRFQCLKWTLKCIADEYGRSEESVRSGLRSVAKAIGVTRRTKL